MTIPGATQFTRILSRAHSAARLLVSWFIAPVRYAVIIKLMAHKKNYTSICIIQVQLLRFANFGKPKCTGRGEMQTDDKCFST
jgi:hypothetical protein